MCLAFSFSAYSQSPAILPSKGSNCTPESIIIFQLQEIILSFPKFAAAISVSDNDTAGLLLETLRAIIESLGAIIMALQEYNLLLQACL